MKKFTLLACSLAMAFSAFAAEIIVESPAEYADKYASAVNGDVLLLKSGSYANQNFPADRIITVKAFADTCEVSLTGEIRGTDVGGNGSGLIFEGVTLGNGASYLMNFAPTGIVEKIQFKNCILENVARCTFYMSGDEKTSAVKTVLFENCTLRNLNSGNWNFCYQYTPIYSWTFDNCTFYGNEGMESFYCPRASYGDKSHQFIFTNNTFYSGCRDANRSICGVSNKFEGVECKLVFTDNIILCPAGASAGKLFDVSAGFWDVTITNNLIDGWGIPSLSEELGLAVVDNNYTLADLGLNIGGVFADAANGDFTLYKGVSPLDDKSTTGGMLGAAKWTVEAGSMFTLVQGVAEGCDSMGTVSGTSGLVPEGKSVTLTAVPNYGFKFVKWIDGNGATLSEDISYTFTMDGDKTVYAEFAALTMYSLNVTCTNGGHYLLSEQGENGLYPEGTEIVISATTNFITEFVMATEAKGDMYFGTEFTVVMNDNKDITMEFVQKDYICGWDFTEGDGVTSGGASQNRPADWLSPSYQTDTEVPTLDLYYTLYPDQPWTSGWWNRTDTYPAAVTWLRCTDSGDGTEYKLDGGAMDSSKYYDNVGFYWQTSFCTRDYKTDASFHFSIKRTYMGHYIYKVQTSYDGNSWESVNDSISSNGWADYDVMLPNTANKERVYVRLIPDVNSGYETSRLFDVYGVYVANIFFTAEPTVAIETVESEAEDAPIFDLMGRRVKSADAPGIYIQNGKKFMIK